MHSNCQKLHLLWISPAIFCVNQKSCYSVPPHERQVFFMQVEVGEGILGDPNAKS